MDLVANKVWNKPMLETKCSVLGESKPIDFALYIMVRENVFDSVRHVIWEIAQVGTRQS